MRLANGSSPKYSVASGRNSDICIRELYFIAFKNENIFFFDSRTSLSICCSQPSVSRSIPPGWTWKSRGVDHIITGGVSGGVFVIR